MHVARYLVQLVLGILLPLGVQLADRWWLPPGRRERGWNGASWGAALYAFGPFSMVGWCFVTRRRSAGPHRSARAARVVAILEGVAAVALGGVAAVQLALLVGAIDALLGSALGLPAP